MESGAIVKPGLEFGLIVPLQPELDYLSHALPPFLISIYIVVVITTFVKRNVVVFT
jgi:hypothetical protein